MKVQVFIPTFNRRAKLEKAVGSVLAQTHRDLEVVVLDNHSTDGTVEALAALAAADPRVVHVRHDRNIGMVPNFNAIRGRVSADAYCVLTDDDTYEPWFLETALACFARDPRVDLVACSAPTLHEGRYVKNQIDAWREGYHRANTSVFKCLTGQYPLVTNCVLRGRTAPDFVFHEDLGNVGDGTLLTCLFSKYDAWICKTVTGSWNNDQENASTVSPADAARQVDLPILEARHYRAFCLANGIRMRALALYWCKRFLIVLFVADRFAFADLLATSRMREAFAPSTIVLLRLLDKLRVIRAFMAALNGYRAFNRRWIAFRDGNRRSM